MASPSDPDSEDEFFKPKRRSQRYRRLLRIQNSIPPVLPNPSWPSPLFDTSWYNNMISSPDIEYIIPPSYPGILSWDGTPVTSDWSTSPGSNLASAIFPSSDTGALRGVSQLYTSIEPFSDDTLPTPEEMEYWFYRCWFHMNQMLGITNPFSFSSEYATIAASQVSHMLVTYPETDQYWLDERVRSGITDYPLAPTSPSKWIYINATNSNLFDFFNHLLRTFIALATLQQRQELFNASTVGMFFFPILRPGHSDPKRRIEPRLLIIY